MIELTSYILKGVISIAAMILTAHFAIIIHGAIKAYTENSKRTAMMREVTCAIADAIAATNQTYVDALKKSSMFTPDSQKEALKRTLVTCISSLAPTTKNYIVKTYGNLTNYLTTKVEAAIHNQKI